MVKIRAFRYRSALLLCLTLLTGCPGRGDYYRFNDMEVVRPYGELKSSNVQTDQSERHGPCKYPFRAVRGVINHESH